MSDLYSACAYWLRFWITYGRWGRHGALAVITRTEVDVAQRVKGFALYHFWKPGVYHGLSGHRFPIEARKANGAYLSEVDELNVGAYLPGLSPAIDRKSTRLNSSHSQ